MTDNQQSFYEIQLNTHHLLLAFLGALVIGVAVFYMGVVVGRGQEGNQGAAEEWQAAVESDPAAEGDLDFYDSVQQPAAQPEEDPSGDS